MSETVAASTDVNGAEAQYLLSQILYDQGDYEKSIDALYELNKNFGAYEYWLGRSFMLISDNYVAMDELFQAKATLNSIIENSPEQEVVQEAKDRLRKIEAREAEQQQEKETVDSTQQETENEIIIEEPSNPQ